MIIRIDYQEPDVMLDLWGGTSGTFDGLDRFNRITDQRWKSYGGSPADLDRFKYGYDRDSNHLSKENTVSEALGTPVYMDEQYRYDNLNRLTVMKRGQLSGGTIGSPTKEQDWTLDKTGNWSNFTTKTSGSTDLNQTRTHSPVNQINGITQSTGSAWVSPTYDEAGNTKTMPQVGDPTSGYIAFYDAWNRMVGVSTTAGAGVASYTYDGRGRRITQGYGLTLGPDLYYSNDWQVLEESSGTQYVWGIRYVDELICRDASSTRLYALQDANFNLTSITNSSGAVQERYAYFPYGQRSIFDGNWGTRSSSSYSWLVGHQGLRHDATTGIIENRMRQLHPMLGRFLQRDPLGYVDGMGFYAYVRSRPNSMLDPLGAQGWEEGVVVIGGVTISVEALAAAAAIFGISVWACMVSSACLGKAIELMERDVARAIEDACKEKAKKCKPCVPPAGTKMQRVDVVPPSKKHYPWEGTHTHIYVVNQAPYPNCGCFINPDPLQPDMNGIGPFPPLVPVTGGGPES